MDEERSSRKWREIITPEWSLAILIHVIILEILYVFFLLRPKGESLNTLILNTSTALPLFTLIAVTLMEIWEAVWEVIMLVKRILEKREEKKLQRARVEGAKQKHAEWVEWAKNGRDKPQPKPPKDPEDN